MADILIRNLDPLVETALREKARVARKSLSDVAQDLIRKGLAQPRNEQKLGTAIRNLVSISNFDDLDIPRDSANLPPPNFE